MSEVCLPRLKLLFVLSDRHLLAGVDLLQVDLPQNHRDGDRRHQAQATIEAGRLRTQVRVQAFLEHDLDRAEPPPRS